MRIGIAGINGRVGTMLADAIPARGAVVSGGLLRPGAALSPLLPSGIARFDSIAALAATSDVVIDFTGADATLAHATVLAAAGTAWVLGTTGFDREADEAVSAAASRIAVVQAANFSAGVTLLLALAEQLGAMLPAQDYDAEILEMHHRGKRDAPSGTALALGAAVATGRGASLDALAVRARDGRSAIRPEGAIGFAALRAGAIVGEHTLSFTSAHEQITLSHRAFHRQVFADGAVRAALWLQERAPGRYGMTDVLGVAST